MGKEKADEIQENKRYKKMYLHLFNRVLEAQKMLEEAQQECEEIFMADEEDA